LLNATVLTMFGWRDGEITSKPSNGTSTKFLRPLRTTTGSLIHLIFKEMEDLQTWDVLLQTQDGGNFSDLMEHS
jgi:hypothetical protein